MKRFCSHCGSQLDFSKQLCSCGAYNQFYGIEVAETKEKPAETEPDAMQALVTKRREIEAERSRKQAEMERKEELRRELEQIEKQREERLEKVRLIKEKFEQQEKAEREAAETSLKKEILSVKQEAEQYKMETLALLNELRSELQQIEEENKRLKQEFESLTRDYSTETRQVITLPQAPPVTFEEPAHTEGRKKLLRGGIAVALVVLSVCLMVGALFFYLQPDGGPVKPAAIPGVQPAPPGGTGTAANKSEVPIQKPAVTPATSKGKVVPINPSTPLKPAAVFPATLNTYKIKKDMLGKRLSGCDIAINGFSEISSVSQPELVETLANGQLKYKCSLTIVQGGETYHATPYIYYSPAGQVVKVDGTTCE